MTVLNLAFLLLPVVFISSKTRSTEADYPLSVSSRQPVISFARGVAIISIIGYHFLKQLNLPAPVQKIIVLGGAGIYVFFLISAYGLTSSKHTNWRIFWRKRYEKVLLPYYLAVTLIFGLNCVIPLYKTDGWWEYMSHILLYKMFINNYDCNLGEYLWFVSTIVQFYLVMPWLVRWQQRSRPLVFVGSALVISLLYNAGIMLLGVDHLRGWYSSFIQYLWIYAIGMMLARNGRLSYWVNRPWYIYLITCSVGVITVLALAEWLGRVGRVFNDYFMFMAYGSLVMLIYQLSVKGVWLQRLVLWIESFSYSLYLIHILVFRLYVYEVANRPLIGMDIIIIGGLSIGGALLFQRCTDETIKRLHVLLN